MAETVVPSTIRSYDKGTNYYLKFLSPVEQKQFFSTVYELSPEQIDEMVKSLKQVNVPGQTLQSFRRRQSAVKMRNTATVLVAVSMLLFNDTFPSQMDYFCCWHCPNHFEKKGLTAHLLDIFDDVDVFILPKMRAAMVRPINSAALHHNGTCKTFNVCYYTIMKDNFAYWKQELLKYYQNVVGGIPGLLLDRLPQYNHLKHPNDKKFLKKPKPVEPIPKKSSISKKKELQKMVEIVSRDDRTVRKVTKSKKDDKSNSNNQINNINDFDTQPINQPINCNGVGLKALSVNAATEYYSNMEEEEAASNHSFESTTSNDLNDLIDRSAVGEDIMSADVDDIEKYVFQPSQPYATPVDILSELDAQNPTNNLNENVLGQTNQNENATNLNNHSFGGQSSDNSQQQSQTNTYFQLTNSHLSTHFDSTHFDSAHFDSNINNQYNTNNQFPLQQQIYYTVPFRNSIAETCAAVNSIAPILGATAYAQTGENHANYVLSDTHHNTVQYLSSETYPTIEAATAAAVSVPLLLTDFTNGIDNAFNIKISGFNNTAITSTAEVKENIPPQNIDNSIANNMKNTMKTKNMEKHENIATNAAVIDDNNLTTTTQDVRKVHKNGEFVHEHERANSADSVVDGVGDDDNDYDTNTTAVQQATTKNTHESIVDNVENSSLPLSRNKTTIENSSKLDNTATKDDDIVEDDANGNESDSDHSCSSCSGSDSEPENDAKEQQTAKNQQNSRSNQRKDSGVNFHSDDDNSRLLATPNPIEKVTQATTAAVVNNTNNNNNKNKKRTKKASKPSKTEVEEQKADTKMNYRKYNKKTKQPIQKVKKESENAESDNDDQFTTDNEQAEQEEMEVTTTATSTHNHVNNYQSDDESDNEVDEDIEGNENAKTNHIEQPSTSTVENGENLEAGDIPVTDVILNRLANERKAKKVVSLNSTKPEHEEFDNDVVLYALNDAKKVYTVSYDNDKKTKGPKVENNQNFFNWGEIGETEVLTKAECSSNTLNSHTRKKPILINFDKCGDKKKEKSGETFDYDEVVNILNSSIEYVRNNRTHGRVSLIKAFRYALSTLSKSHHIMNSSLRARSYAFLDMLSVKEYTPHYFTEMYNEYLKKYNAAGKSKELKKDPDARMRAVCNELKTSKANKTLQAFVEFIKCSSRTIASDNELCDQNRLAASQLITPLRQILYDRIPEKNIKLRFTNNAVVYYNTIFCRYVTYVVKTILRMKSTKLMINDKYYNVMADLMESINPLYNETAAANADANYSFISPGIEHFQNAMKSILLHEMLKKRGETITIAEMVKKMDEGDPELLGLFELSLASRTSQYMKRDIVLDFVQGVSTILLNAYENFKLDVYDRLSREAQSRYTIIMIDEKYFVKSLLENLHVFRFAPVMRMCCTKEIHISPNKGPLTNMTFPKLSPSEVEVITPSNLEWYDVIKQMPLFKLFGTYEINSLEKEKKKSMKRGTKRKSDDSSTSNSDESDEDEDEDESGDESSSVSTVVIPPKKAKVAPKQAKTDKKVSNKRLAEVAVEEANADEIESPKRGKAQALFQKAMSNAAKITEEAANKKKTSKKSTKKEPKSK